MSEGLCTRSRSVQLWRYQRYDPAAEIGGTGHWIQRDKRDVLNRIIDRFLERIGGSS